MLLNRFGSVRGYYQARTDITTNRLGSFVGNGNLLMTLLSEDNLKESVYSDNPFFGIMNGLLEVGYREGVGIEAQELYDDIMSGYDDDGNQIKESYSRSDYVASLKDITSQIVDILDYLDEYDMPFPPRKFSVDSWADWKDEVEMGESDGEIIEDASALLDFLEPKTRKISDDDVEAEDMIEMFRKLQDRYNRFAKIWDEKYGKKENLQENSNRYRNLNKALFGDKSGKIKTWAIVSPQNPLGWKDSTEQEFVDKYVEWTKDKSRYNAEAKKRLKATQLLHKIEQNGDTSLRYSGAKYVPLYGTYGEAERSYMIFNIPLVDAKSIARNYGQESFFFANVGSDNTKIGYYVTHDACKTYDLVEVSEVVTDEDGAEDFFSKFGRKFRINMREFGDDIPAVINQGEFDESFDESRTFMSRAMHRREAYRTQTPKE